MADDLDDTAAVETYVVRMLRAEGTEARSLHGVVTDVADGAAYPFTTGDQLLDTLRQRRPGPVASHDPDPRRDP